MINTSPAPNSIVFTECLPLLAGSASMMLIDVICSNEVSDISVVLYNNYGIIFFDFSDDEKLMHHLLLH